MKPLVSMVVICANVVMWFPLTAGAGRARGTEDGRHLSESDVRRRAAQTRSEKGSGLFQIEFSTSGQATNVKVLKSTGHARLDLAAVKTFRTWRIRPDTGCEGFRIPVIFDF